MKFVNHVLFAKERAASNAIGDGGGASTLRGGGKGKERARDGSVAATRTRGEGDMDVSLSLVEKDRRERFREFGKELPKAWGVLEEGGVDTRNMGLGGSRFGIGSLSFSTAAGLKGPTATADENGLYDVLRGCRRVVVIGIHGWFPGKLFLRLTQVARVSLSFRRCYDPHCTWRGMLIGISYIHNVADYNCKANWDKLKIRQYDRTSAA
jgi:hypothetical protein